MCQVQKYHLGRTVFKKNDIFSRIVRFGYVSAIQIQPHGFLTTVSGLPIPGRHNRTRRLPGNSAWNRHRLPVHARQRRGRERPLSPGVVEAQLRDADFLFGAPVQLHRSAEQEEGRPRRGRRQVENGPGQAAEHHRGGEGAQDKPGGDEAGADGCRQGRRSDDQADRSGYCKLLKLRFDWFLLLRFLRKIRCYSYVSGNSRGNQVNRRKRRSCCNGESHGNPIDS